MSAAGADQPFGEDSQRNETNPLALYQKVSSLMKEGHTEEAEPLIFEMIDKNPSSAPGHYFLGLVRLKNEDMEGAVVSFEKSIECGARDAQIYYLLASALARNGDLIKARQAYHKAIKARPGMGAAYHDLGILCYRIGDFDECVKNLKIALQHDPNNAKTILMLGVAYIRAGKPENAVEMVTSLRAVNDETKAVHLESLLRQMGAQKRFNEPENRNLTPGGASSLPVVTHATVRAGQEIAPAGVSTAGAGQTTIKAKGLVNLKGRTIKKTNTGS